MNQNSGANLNRRGFDIARVAMPLVRLMREGSLSWSQKEQIADLIGQLLYTNESHKAEQDHLSGRSAEAQMRAAEKALGAMGLSQRA
jgi:hypothetical protein